MSNLYICILKIGGRKILPSARPNYEKRMKKLSSFYDCDPVAPVAPVGAAADISAPLPVNVAEKVAFSPAPAVT